jgi:hypothetical protein
LSVPIDAIISHRASNPERTVRESSHDLAIPTTRSATSAQRARDLGAYNGVDLWTLRSWALKTPQERVFASLHERLHHELQHTTLWGLITRFADDYRQDAAHRRTAALLFWTGVMRAQRVHETYATTLAAGMDPEYTRLLDANPEHRAHHARGLALIAPTPDSWPRERFVIDALLRACMQAPGLEHLAATMPTIRLADFDRPEHRPDQRLDHLEALDLRPLRDVVTEPPGSIRELEDVHDACAAYLTDAGLACLDSAALRRSTEALVERARVQLGLRIEIDVLRDDPVGEDAAEFQRERAELHDAPLPLEILDFLTIGDRTGEFMRSHPSFGTHVVVVWARANVLGRQFAPPNALLTRQDFVLGLQAAGAGPGGEPLVRLALVDELTDPTALAGMFTQIRTLILTTLSSLVDAPQDARFGGDQDLYVLVDQPAVEALRHAFSRGAVARWSRLAVNGDLQLLGICWELDALPGVIHLHLATDAAHYALVRWLNAQPASRAVLDQELLRVRRPQIDAVVQHVVAAWWRLERTNTP